MHSLTYSISGAMVSFSLGSYNSSYPLIIEIDQGVGTGSNTSQTQNLVWSTFHGSYRNDPFSANALNGDDYWIVGRTQSSDFLDETGFSSFLIEEDVVITRFSLGLAKLEWNSFLVGSSRDYGEDIDINPDNEHCFVVGVTFSDDLVESSSVGINVTTLDGNSDGYIYELDAEGAYEEDNLLRSYIGSESNEEGCLNVEFEKYDGISISPRVYITGSGNYFDPPYNNFPIVPSTASGAFNLGSPTGSWDGFLVRLDENMQIDWSTFFGGTGWDEIKDLNVTPTSVYISGITSVNSVSTTCAVPSGGEFPLCNSTGTSTIESAPIGSQSHFVAEFEDDQLVWSTHIPYGTSGGNKIGVIEDGLDDYLYLTGGSDHPNFTTYPSLGINAYNLPNNANTHGYLAKYKNRQINWRTKLFGLPDGPSALDTYNSELGMGVIIGNSLTVSSGSLPYTSIDCSLPLSGEFPKCDDIGDYFIDEEPTGSFSIDFGRMALMLFDINDELRWSTFFGNNAKNQFRDFKFNENRLLSIGTGNNNTLEEFDEMSDEDYFKEINWQAGIGTVDGLIAMFDVSELLVGINENSFKDNPWGITISPNPFNDFIDIYFNDKLNEDFGISIFNIQGQLLLDRQMSIRNVSSETSFRLNTESLINGVYIIEISTENSVVSSKLIKQ